MRIFSTFSGIGGFEIGIQNAYRSTIGRIQENPPGNEGQGLLTKTGQDSRSKNGWTSERPSDITDERPLCVGYSEIDKYAIKVYERNFPNVPNYGDITKINAEELPDFDCLVGGFPCQAFSIAGKRKGFDDTRGTLFFDLARILREKQPMYGVFENVKGLVNHDKGQTFDTILETLQELGYYCNWEIYNSKDFGVPQNRERVYLVCQNLRGLTNIGQSKTITSSERLIQSYLFQLLLNNLNEVKKLQEHESKDSVLGYLIWKEIDQSQKSNENGSTSAGITTGMVESKSQLRGEEAWQNIVTWLSKELDVDLSEPNTSTISTVIKKITPSTTYTFSQMQALIWLATVVLRQSQKSLWNQVLSDLTLIQEGTKYARINRKTEEAVVTESGTVHLPNIHQEQHDKYIVGHLRGTTRPEVFPITGDDGTDSRLSGHISNTLTARYEGAQAVGTYIGEGELNAQEVKVGTLRTHKDGNGFREMQSGVSPTIPARAREDGSGQPVVIAAQRGRYNEEGQIEQQFEPRFDGVSNTLTAVQKDNMLYKPAIRRLTPIECERLQGFPDNWTKYGEDEHGVRVDISDTQRYKMCGNAVTTNVVQLVFERILCAN